MALDTRSSEMRMKEGAPGALQAAITCWVTARLRGGRPPAVQARHGCGPTSASWRTTHPAGRALLGPQSAQGSHSWDRHVWDRHVWGAGCQLQHQPWQCWLSPPWDAYLAECVKARDSVPGFLVQSTAPNTSWRACQPRRDALSSKERGTLDMRGSPQPRGPCGQAVFLGPFQESEGYQWSRNSVKGPQAPRHQKT